MKRKNILLSLFAIISLLLVITIILVNQNNFIETTKRDDQRKQYVNSVYFYLTEKYYKQNQYYPEFITEDILNNVNVGDYKNTINSPNSDYSYQTSDCQNNQCQYFEIKAKMELEADYIKSN